MFPIASAGSTSERKPSSGASRGTDDADGSDGLVHGDRDIAERRIVHGAVELVGPRRVGKNALEAEIEFGGGLLVADDRGQTADDFVAPLGKILRAVVKNLRPIMRRCFRPGFGLARSLDRVANVFAIAERSFAQQSPIGANALPCCSRNRDAPACRRCRA